VVGLEGAVISRENRCKVCVEIAAPMGNVSLSLNGAKRSLKQMVPILGRSCRCRYGTGTTTLQA